MYSSSRKYLLVLISFLLLFILVELGILLGDKVSNEKYQAELAANEQKRRDMLLPRGDDYVQGDVDADVLLVVYADMECQYCKQLHFKLNRLVEDYQSRGLSVARMHRHAPLGIWDKSVIEARAAECVAEGGGSDGFYSFLDRVYTVTPSNNGLDLSLLPGLAVESGGDLIGYEECMTSERYTDKIRDQKLTATILRVSTIPHTFIVGPETIYEIVGNKPEETFRFFLDEALAESL